MFDEKWLLSLMESRLLKFDDGQWSAPRFSHLQYVSVCLHVLPGCFLFSLYMLIQLPNWIVSLYLRNTLILYTVTQRDGRVTPAVVPLLPLSATHHCVARPVEVAYNLN